MSLANDNFCFHYLRHPPWEHLYFSNTPLFTSIFWWDPPPPQFLISLPTSFCERFLTRLPNHQPHPPSLPKIIFRVKSFLCLSHMLSWTLLLLFFLSFLSFLVIVITIRSPTRAVLCCLVRRRSSIPTASSSTWTKLSIGTARIYGKWKLFCLTASLQIKTSNFKNTCGRKPHRTGHQHPT